MRQYRLHGAFLVAVVLVGESAWAGGVAIYSKAESERYGEKTVGMLGRGLLNITTGYVDLLTRTFNETTAGPPVLGTLRGLFLGTGCGVLRTASGVIDWATFWVPGFHGAPVSPSYDDCLNYQFGL